MQTTPGVTSVPGRVQLLRIGITDFRNIARAEIDVPPDGIAVVGDNGQGKTNLLEAVAYLEVLRSMRGARDRDLVRFGADVFRVVADTAGTRTQRVAMAAARTGEKRVSLDGVDQVRLGDAIGAVPSVCVSPADVVLVAGGPADRRRLLDVTLALTDPAYLGALRQYRGALLRRNAALRSPRHGRVAAHAAAHAAARAWDGVLAMHGATLVRGRHAWVAEFASRFTALAEAIGEPGAMTMRYDTAFGAHDDVAAEIADALDASAELDARRGATQRGPHRDDLALCLGDQPLRSMGSAGQHRTAAIALRLLAAETFRARTGVQPLLLLDDPFAELDSTRAARVLSLIERATSHGIGQVLLCVPREEEIPPAFLRLERWGVSGGTFARRSGGG